MNAPNPFRWRRAVALGLVSLPLAGAADANEPWPDPPRPTRTVEVLHGTTRVWPPPPAVAPEPSKPQPTPAAPAMRPPQIWEDPPPRVWEDPRPRPESKSEPPVVEVRPIILTGHTVTAPSLGHAPWLNPVPAAALPAAPVAPAAQPAAPVPIQIQAVPPATPPAPTQPQQPTVVVVREPSEPRPAYALPPEQPRGFGTEALLGIAIGAAGLGFGYAGWRRKTNADAGGPDAPAKNAVVFAPPQSSGVLLMGKYDAGPRKETAERFEIGMSYETEQQEKKKTKEQEEASVLEFILSQNIALHADLAEADHLPEPSDDATPDQQPGERGA